MRSVVDLDVPFIRELGPARKLVDDTKTQLDTEVRRARDELRREVSDLAVAVAEKLVHKTLREDDHRRIVAEAIAGMKVS